MKHSFCCSGTREIRLTHTFHRLSPEFGFFFWMSFEGHKKKKRHILNKYFLSICASDYGGTSRLTKHILAAHIVMIIARTNAFWDIICETRTCCKTFPQVATVQEVLMARYAKHVGPLCENARNAPERRSSRSFAWKHHSITSFTFTT